MKTKFYLYVRKSGPDWGSNPGSVRTTKFLGQCQVDEVAIAMDLDIPDALFKRPSLSASIIVPQDVVPAEIQAKTIDNIKKVFEQSIDFKVRFEVEGLSEESGEDLDVKDN